MELKKDQPITINYLRSTEPAPYAHIYDNELAGEYMVHDTIADARTETNMLQGWEYGQIHFRKPLYIEPKGGERGRSWEDDLKIIYGGKAGNELAAAIKRDGYDAVIVKNGVDFGEIINLGGEKLHVAQKTITAAEAMRNMALEPQR